MIFCRQVLSCYALVETRESLRKSLDKKACFVACSECDVWVGWPPGASLRLLRFVYHHKWVANWLILPEVICLSQRLSHACVSSRWLIAKLRTAHYNSTNLLGCSNSKRITAAIRELILAKSVARRVFPFLKSITFGVFWGIEGT